MKTLSFSSLVIEVTRRCNQQCKMCLRAKAQDADMKEEYLRAILERTRYVGTVTFTGGEPSLALPIIRRFYELAEEYDNVPSAFYIATNGLENQLELAQLCLELYDKSDEKEMCGVSISVDDFHKSEGQSGILRGLAFYDDSKENFYSTRTHKQEPRTGRYDEWVIREGLAETNGIGEPRKPLNFYAEESYDDGVQIDLAYLSCDGRVYPDCDLSYDTMAANPGIPVAELYDEMRRVISDDEET